MLVEGRNGALLRHKTSQYGPETLKNGNSKWGWYVNKIEMVSCHVPNYQEGSSAHGENKKKRRFAARNQSSASSPAEEQYGVLE